MNVSITKDEWGIQLCTDLVETDHCLELGSEDDLWDIFYELRKYLENTKEVSNG